MQKDGIINGETVAAAVLLIKEGALKLTASEKVAEQIVASDYFAYDPFRANQTRQLIQSVQLMDLTSLVGGESREVIEQLCHMALHPLHPDLVSEGHLVSLKDIRTAAVCLYPECIPFAKEYFDKHVPGSGGRPAIATVTGFPSGSAPIADKLKETAAAAAAGADEIDIVIDKSQVLDGKWRQLYDEMRQAKELCTRMSVKLKVILKTGDLGSYDNIYKASMVCMFAGADFIKTSTGKETVNATLETGIVMTTAIRDYHMMTGIRVGFKPAGGIRTAADALQWSSLMNRQLGTEWMSPNLFRFGASSLLQSLDQELQSCINCEYKST